MLPSAQELSNLLGNLYDAADDPRLWAPFLRQVAEASQASSAALVMHDFDEPACTVSTSWGLDPELQRLYEVHYHSLDVWAQRGLLQPEGTICLGQAICPMPELKRMEIYNDLFAPSGIEHAAFAVLKNSESCLAGFSLYRDDRRPEFTETDLRLLQFLAPHLRRAFKLHSRISELRAHSDGVEAGMNALAAAVILLAANGRIVFMNRSALALVGEKDGLTAGPSGLRAERAGESTLLANTIQRAATISNRPGDLPGDTLLVSRRTRTPLQVFVAPIRNTVVNTPGTVAVAVFVSDPLRVQRPASAILRARYGLTPAECRVALLLGDGHAPKDIAGMVGVSVETVRSQIKSIFSKTNVRRQSELVRLLLSNCVQLMREPARK